MMNNFDLACALFSQSAYRELVHTANRLEPVAGSIRLAGDLGYVTGSQGFEASAFEFDGKIVIAYAGTNTNQMADLFTDAALGGGFAVSQLTQAAAFYESIKNDARYAGKDIVFTGHSLGGGLAAAMGVFFNKRAVTFDPANFRLAVCMGNAEKVRAYLAAQDPVWGNDPDLLAYRTQESEVWRYAPSITSIVTSIVAARFPNLAPLVASLPYPTEIRGESLIKAYSVSGEFLTNGYKGFLGTDLNALRIQNDIRPESIDINPLGAKLGLFDLHAMTLLVIGGVEPRMGAILNRNPEVIEAFFDEGLYKRDTR